MVRTLALSVSVIAMTWAASALADSPKLKGAYGFTGSAACLVAPGHVGNENVPPPLPNPTPGVALPNSGFNAKLQPNDFTDPGTSPSASYNRSSELRS
jgi:hypothetical protein